MPPVTPRMVQARREKDCYAFSLERKYYRVDGSFIKRSLRPSEWQHNEMNGCLYIPRFGVERILNEGAALRHITKHTNIPVPKLYACFEDDGAAYLITELVEGVELADLDPDKRKIVETEVEGYLETLRSLTSKNWGGPSGIVSKICESLLKYVVVFYIPNPAMKVLPPFRVLDGSSRPSWRMKPRESEDLVFCHGDFSAHNIIVDPATLKVKAIIDWEYAGFFPREFEGLYFRRPGPSVAIEGETDDTEQLITIMKENAEPFGWS